MVVYALKDTATGMFWNRIHKDFRPLSQNTLFLVNEGQVKRATEYRTMGYIRRCAFENKNVIAVKIEITEQKD